MVLIRVQELVWTLFERKPTRTLSISGTDEWIAAHGWSSSLTSTACPNSRSKPTTQMQCSQVEKRSHGSRKASSGSSSPPGPGGRVISSAGEMLLASWSSRSSGSSTCSPSSSGPCRAMSTARSGNLVALKNVISCVWSQLKRYSGEETFFLGSQQLEESSGTEVSQS